MYVPYFDLVNPVLKKKKGFIESFQMPLYLCLV